MKCLLAASARSVFISAKIYLEPYFQKLQTNRAHLLIRHFMEWRKLIHKSVSFFQIC